MLLIILFTILFIIIFKLIQNHFDFFKNHNVPYIKPYPIFGAFKDFIYKKQSVFEVFDDIYKNSELKDEPFYGFFMFHKPCILVKNPDLIKRILVKDFNHFCDRAMKVNESDPMHCNLAFLQNPEWKRVRSKLSPAFSSAKLRSAFHQIDKVATSLCNLIESNLEDNRCEINLKEISEHFTIDVTSNALFGFDPDTIGGNSSELVEALHSVHENYFKSALSFFAAYCLPLIFESNFFGVQYISFMKKLMRKTFEEREKDGKVSNDFVDLLMELRDKRELSDDEVFAQAAFFFFGGYESTSSVLSLLLYELSKNSQIQLKIQQEIDSFDEISYETIAHSKNLPYLDKVVQETLRLYPLLPIIAISPKTSGYSSKPFSDFKISSDLIIFIPVYALGQDEKYFKNPLTFNPENFNQEIPFEAHMPFGKGPRSCIGERFALIVIKTAVVRNLKQFRIEMSEKTPDKVTIKDRAFIMGHKEDLIVDFVKR